MEKMNWLLIVAVILSCFATSMGAKAATDGADQILPVPAQLQEPVSTSITVKGEPGASQADATVRVIRLTLDASGRIKRGTGSTSAKHELGEQVAVDAGRYMVSYSGSSIVVDVSKDEHKLIELQKGTVPRVDGSYTFKIFPDLSSRDQQLQRVLFTWLTPLPVKFNCYTYNGWGRILETWTETKSTEALCAQSAPLQSLGKKYCAAFTSANYENLIGNCFKFNADASYQLVVITFEDDCGYDSSFTEDSASIKSLGRIFIANGVDGDFVSLLPGTYGIQMTNHSGETASKLGIVVESGKLGDS